MTDHQSVMPDWDAWFGAMDMYVLDQLRKGNIHTEMRILDAGCGHGRNIHFFLKAGADVWAFDHNEAYVDEQRLHARHFQPDASPQKILHADGAHIPFEDAQFDLVISSAVLHFAQNDEHFEKMLDELVRVLAPGGLLLMRFAMKPATEVVLEALGNNHFLHPGDTIFYLPPYTMKTFKTKLEEKGLELVEQPKLTQVHMLRAMSTWVARK
jgi:ubiquinone/menaquinone biosynthesis C-methylase UbiE